MPSGRPTAPEYQGNVNLGESYGNAIDVFTNPEYSDQLIAALNRDLSRYVDAYNSAATQQAFGQGSQFDWQGAMQSFTPEVAGQYQSEFERIKQNGDPRSFGEWLPAALQRAAESGDPNAIRTLEEHRRFDPNSDIGRAIDAASAVSQAEREALSSNRRSTMEDVATLGPQLNDIIRNANPELQAAMEAAGAMGGRSDFYGGLEGLLGQQRDYGDVTAQQIGRGELGDSLYQQALGANRLGEVGTQLQGRASEFANSRGELNADELRQLQQDVRAGYAARGTEMGAGAITGESMARLTNQRQRMMEDIQAANSLNNANLAEIQGNRSFQMGVQGQDLARQEGNRAIDFSAQLENRQFDASQDQQNINNQAMLGQLLQGQQAQDRNYALSYAGAQQASTIDPWQAYTGISSMAPQMGVGMGQNAYGNASGITGNNLIDPSAGVNVDLMNAANRANYDSSIFGAQAGMYAGEQQAKAAKQSSGMGLLGDIIKAAAPMIPWCWVAREVYGVDNPKWLEFREWMLSYAPKWFVKLYGKHGPAFAQYISNKPRLKKLIKYWMDGRIRTLRRIKENTLCPL